MYQGIDQGIDQGHGHDYGQGLDHGQGGYTIAGIYKRYRDNTTPGQHTIQN